MVLLGGATGGGDDGGTGTEATPPPPPQAVNTKVHRIDAIYFTGAPVVLQYHNYTTLVIWGQISGERTLVAF